MFAPRSVIFLLCLALPAAGADTPAATDKPGKFRSLLGEELRSQLVAEAAKFSHKGDLNWGQMAEQRRANPSTIQDLPLIGPVVTPPAEEVTVVKRRDGDWLRYVATVEDPERNLQIEVKDFKQIDRNTAQFSVQLHGKLKIELEAMYYRMDMVLLKTDGTALEDLVLVADCRAKLKDDKDSADVELKVEPRKPDAPTLTMTRIATRNENEGRKVAAQLQKLIDLDLRLGNDKLKSQAETHLRKALAQARVKNALVELLRDK